MYFRQAVRHSSGMSRAANAEARRKCGSEETPCRCACSWESIRCRQGQLRQRDGQGTDDAANREAQKVMTRLQARVDQQRTARSSVRGPSRWPPCLPGLRPRSRRRTVRQSRGAIRADQFGRPAPRCQLGLVRIRVHDNEFRRSGRTQHSTAASRQASATQDAGSIPAAERRSAPSGSTWRRRAGTSGIPPTRRRR